MAKIIKECTDDDGNIRNCRWLQAVTDGLFSFAIADPKFRSSGPGSWKELALGTKHARICRWKKFHYSPSFSGSHWKRFHDAAQAHQMDILREILPLFGIDAI